jgi:NADH:ubiquinone oxidoreductase subunit K
MQLTLLINYFTFMLSLGLFGLQLHEFNLVIYFMNLEVALIAISMLYFVASLIIGNSFGYLFCIYILAIAGCESAIALILIILLQRSRVSIALEKINGLRF